MIAPAARDRQAKHTIAGCERSRRAFSSSMFADDRRQHRTSNYRARLIQPLFVDLHDRTPNTRTLLERLPPLTGVELTWRTSFESSTMKTARPAAESSIDAGTPGQPRPAESRGISMAAVRCRLRGRTLLVPPFRITRHQSTYISATEVEIDLTAVAPGRYRVLAVHNFHVEDCNPRLDECIAAVFLAARRKAGTWEEPERFPIECRALQVLAIVDVAAGAGTPTLIA